MALPVQSPLAASPHRNQQLFSDHYLNLTLPARADWQQLVGQAAPVMTAIQQIFQAYVPSENEAQTEKDLIQPILQALGHTFEVQAPLKTPDGTKKPDYVFYSDLAGLNAHKGQVLTDELPQQGGFAVGDAKYWGRALDQALKGKSGDPFTNKNPSYQIAFYIQHSGVDWGILTNGRLWRLYHKDTAHKLDHFYEVDLPDLLGDVNRFLYFYAFFHRAAFEAHPLGVQAILQQSIAYARGVGDTLKTQVYDALRHLAQGFLDYGPNKLQAEPDTLKPIYDASLILLYRLLFILYAEARELLPVYGNDQYRQSYSLRSIKEAVARDLEFGRTLRSNSALLWPRLKELFRIVDDGDPALGVATYNGGLFDAEKHPFLEQYTVGDAHLQQAIDKLARVDKQFVDYRDLAVRHLGTIYEGLLAYHLEARPEGDWKVALLNDNDERHTTGSYYTPDFIVKYMVDQALGPVLEEALAGAATDAERVQAVLALNVLDPAMGSGHFLVEATEYIARRLVELDVPLPNEDTSQANDLAGWKRRVAQACIYGVDLNPLAVELAKLSLWLITVAKDRPLSFLDHHLRPGNSLVGARLTDLGLSQPDSTAAKRSRKQAQQAAAGQLSMLDDEAFRQAMSTAVDAMWLIEASPSATAQQVKEQEQIYQSLRETLTRKYGRLANLVTARRFGLTIEVDPTQYRSLTDYATGRIIAALPKFVEWLEDADKRAEQHHFFHWELEFPEVFFDRHGHQRGEQGGFNVVIGNPPYVRQETLGASYKAYYAAAYADTYDGVADIYVYFFHQGLQLARAAGRMSYIVTNKWMRAGYGAALRDYLANHSVVEQLVDFGHAPIFEGVDVFPCIVVLEKPPVTDWQPELMDQVQLTEFPREMLQKVALGRYVREHHISVPQQRFGRSPWNLEAAPVYDLLAKIRHGGTPLAEFAGVKPYRGVLTGLNEAFLIDTPTRNHLVGEDARAGEIIKPFLRGQDMGRWLPDWHGMWLIVLKSSSDYTWPWSTAPETAEESFRQTYPALYNHMKPLEDKLRTRQDKGRYWWELRACAYYDVFARPKLMYQEIQFHPQYCFDTSGLFTNNKGFLLPNADLWLLAVLNSPLMWWHNWRFLPHMKDEALSPVGVLMETLPIAPPTDAVRAEVEPAVARLIAITHARQQATVDTLDWLHTEFGVETPGQRLEDFATLDTDAFIAEVRKRRPKAAGVLTPGGLKALRTGYDEQALPIQDLQAEAAGLERRLADLVNTAYGLTPEEVDLLWATAPPRMPRF